MDDDFFEFNEIETERAGMQYHELPSQGFNHSPKNYVCVSCDKHYQAFDLLHDHMKEHQEYQQHSSQSHQTERCKQGTQYQCDFGNCSKTFSLYAHLQKHVRGHDQERLFECNFQNCEQKFSLKSNLKRHQKVHTKEKPFLCQECEKSFATTTNLKQHLQVHLGQNKREIYECTVGGCNKKYFYLCNLKKHKKEHSDESDELPLVEPQELSFSMKYGQVELSFNTRPPTEGEGVLIYRPSLAEKVEETGQPPMEGIDYKPELVATGQEEFVNGLFSVILTRPTRKVVVILPVSPELKLMEGIVRRLSSLPKQSILEQISFNTLKKEDIGRICSSFLERMLKPATVVKDEQS